MRAYFLLLLSAACSTDTFTGPDASGDGANLEAGVPCEASFCANAKATTCDDFDESQAPDKWSNDTTIGTIGTTQTTTTSCPNAMQVVFPSISNPPVGTEPHAYAVAQLGNPGEVTVTLDALLPNIQATDGESVDGFVFFALRATLDGGWAVRLERSADTAWFLRLHQGAGGSEPSVAVPDILLGAWNHMQLTVHYAMDTTGTVSFTYQTTTNATPTVQITKQPTLPPAGFTQVSTFAVGAGALSAISQQYTMLYDSITIDAN